VSIRKGRFHIRQSEDKAGARVRVSALQYQRERVAAERKRKAGRHKLLIIQTVTTR
jgi:hypothetical protein